MVPFSIKKISPQAQSTVQSTAPSEMDTGLLLPLIWRVSGLNPSALKDLTDVNQIHDCLIHFLRAQGLRLEGTLGFSQRFLHVLTPWLSDSCQFSLLELRPWG